MTKFTTFTRKELNNIEFAFSIAHDNMGLGTWEKGLKNLAEEVSAEIKLREKEDEKTTRFTAFTDEELKDIESAFHWKGVKHLIEEVRAERKYRELVCIKDEFNSKVPNDQLKRLAMNSNYGAQVSSCDDEKLVVLCMINKQLKEMQNTIVKINECWTSMINKHLNEIKTRI